MTEKHKHDHHEKTSHKHSHHSSHESGQKHAHSEKSDSRPRILLQDGKTHRAVSKVAKILRPHCEHLGVFQRAGELVRVVCLPEGHEDKQLNHPKGARQLQTLTAVALTDVFNKVAIFEERNSSGVIRLDCPREIAHIYMSRTGEWRVPVLRGIISTPIMRPDGTLLQRPGYDEASKLLRLREKDWPEVPKHPTLSDAKAALATLREPFAEFPWVKPECESVHIACILTAIQRRFLPACPLFGYDAPAQRSGKSILAESVATIATGKPAAATAFSREKDEIRKTIFSVLRAGYAITNFDNVEHPMASPDLAMALTQSKYQDRILGKNLHLSLPTNVLWTATGNNLLFKGDLTSRALCCRIDAATEHPETRHFKIADLPGYVKTHRKKLVAAALTILLAYKGAGSPEQKAEPWGGFDA